MGRIKSAGATTNNTGVANSEKSADLQ